MEVKKRRIVGVVENHFDDFQRAAETEPFVFYLVKPEKYQYMVVNADSDDLTATYNYLETTWRELFPVFLSMHIIRMISCCVSIAKPIPAWGRSSCF